MEELLTAIKEEEVRIADSYANEYALAKAREKMLAGSLAQAVGENETGSHAQVKMRELESSADAVRNLYNSFLRGRIPDPKLRRLTGHKSEAMSDQYTTYRPADFDDVKQLAEGLFSVNNKRG